MKNENEPILKFDEIKIEINEIKENKEITHRALNCFVLYIEPNNLFIAKEFNSFALHKYLENKFRRNQSNIITNEALNSKLPTVLILRILNNKEKTPIEKDKIANKLSRIK